MFINVKIEPTLYDKKRMKYFIPLVSLNFKIVSNVQCCRNKKYNLKYFIKYTEEVQDLCLNLSIKRNQDLVTRKEIKYGRGINIL